jgi:hypothetical protein
MRGLSRGFSRGARSFRELLQRLAHLRFRGFSIARRGAIFIVYAHFNPRWPIATLRLNLRLIRDEITAIVEEAGAIVREGRGVYRRYIDLPRAARDEIAAVLRRNRALINEARRLRRAGRLTDTVLDDFLFRIEGHHAVPMWMGGPTIPYRSAELLGVVRALHNFDPSGFHAVLARIWAGSRTYGRIAVNDGDAVRALFRAASRAERARLLDEIRTILTQSYHETFGPGPAFQHSIEVMEEGLANFRY